MLKEIHEQPRVAARDSCTCSTPRRTSTRWYELMRSAGTSTGRLRHELPRLHGRGRLARSGRRPCRDPGAGAAIHRAIRTDARPGRRGDLRQPVGRDQGRAQRAGGGRTTGYGLLRPANVDRFHADAPGRPIYLPLACGYEISVPATKTFTNQVVAFLYLALRMAVPGTEFLARCRISGGDDRLDGRRAGRGDRRRVRRPGTICTASDTARPTRSRSKGALKLKEITYAHCEGMLSTEFKHGPLSAVTAVIPIVFVRARPTCPLLISGINEVKVRGGTDDHDRRGGPAPARERRRPGGHPAVRPPGQRPARACCRSSCSRTR